MSSQRAPSRIQAQPVPGSVRFHAESFGYRYSDGSPWLLGMDFELRAGERVLVSGASGSGKSTLLYALQGIVPGVLGGAARGALRRGGGRTLLALQNPDAALLAPTVLDEVSFGASGPVDDGAARAALEDLGIARLAARPPRSLSAGQRQRLVLACVLARDPAALLLDEPLSQLDEEGAMRLHGLLRAPSGDRLLVVAGDESDGGLSLPFDRRIALSGASGDGAQEAGGPLPSPGEELLSARGLGLSNAWGAPMLDGAGLSLRRGELVRLVGRNGSGKSSLLKVLAGVWKPARGTLERAPRARVGYLPQNPEQLLFHGTVEEEVGFAAPARARRERVEAVCGALGLSDLLGRSPHRLSLGQKQRVALASVLAGDHDVLLLDEPAAHLDPKAARGAWALVREAAGRGAAVVVTDHRTSRPSAAAGRELTLVEGRVDGGSEG